MSCFKQPEAADETALPGPIVHGPGVPELSHMSHVWPQTPDLCEEGNSPGVDGTLIRGELTLSQDHQRKELPAHHAIKILAQDPDHRPEGKACWECCAGFPKSPGCERTVSMASPKGAGGPLHHIGQ